LGQDVTIVRMDFGTFEASVSEGYEFGPIFIGPFPITAEVGLAFSAEARFAMGYDTRGLRQVLDGGNPIKLFNGIFIDDLNTDGLDVDEWKLTFRVSAEAALDLLIVEAGVYGGVDSILSGDLDDPNPDGKLYIDEIVDKLSNPICLFTISGKLDLFLGFYVEVDLLLWSDRWELEIMRVTLLDFTLGCSGTDPNLADVDGDGNLWLNMGDRAHLRGIQEDEIDEEFTVRQIGPGKVSIEAFGIKEEESGITGIILANAGDGDDIIAFVKGGDDENPIAFTIGSNLNGGSGNDSFTGGDGVDILSGGSGVDRLIGGKGNDVINGDGEDDRIDGGIGDDTLNGGGGNDMVTGGPGADTMDGGDGNDSLLGGPWTDANPDGADTIVGGPGNDSIDGGPGDDLLYGDESGLGCLDDGAAPGGIDSILGGPGNDTLVGGNNDDNLIGNEGNDKLCGNGGNDILDGDDDDPSTADTGDRDDSGGGGFAGGLFGGSGDDVIYGRGGDDEMFGGADDDEMYGALGNDTMNGDAGADEMYGDAGTDTMNGNAGDDNMYGGDGADIMSGNGDSDTMYGDGGEDVMYGNAGGDTMRGGPDNDTMRGNAGDDEMYGDSGNDAMYGNENDDTLRGNAGDDYMEGNAGADTMYGDAGQDDMIGGSSGAGQPDEGDFMFGNADQDVMVGDNATITRPGGVEIDGTIVRSVTLHDLATGNADTPHAGPDTMQGNAGNDDMYGGGENDTLNGNADDDYIEGNGGTDTLYGDAGQDDLVGGTSQGGGGQPDGADTIYGGSNGPALAYDFDVIAGDNASIVRAQNGGVYVTDDFAPDTMGVVRRIVTLYDVATTTSPALANTSGGDTLFGEDGFDIMYGQGGDEVDMSGGSGNDVMYGNEGDDVMLGNDGQDDLIGGTGRTKSDDPSTAVDGRLDGADTITGGSGTPDADTDDYDVILGDNATVFKALDGDGAWVVNTFNAAIARDIYHYDVGTVTYAPAGDVSGGDLLRGEDHDDIMYGQGGDDNMQGDGGDDYMEGNAGTDTMSGNLGNDDMVGGTGRINDDPATGVNGRLDANDLMYGNEGFDVMAGDNAILVRTLIDGQWVSNTFNDGIQHEDRILLDENSSDALFVSGADEMHGGAQDDLMYGQAGDDQMYGDDDDDLMEGNSDSDTMRGGADQDDMIGGTVDASIWDGADTMYGGPGGDVMAGDNAIIERPLVDGLWQIEPNTQDELRTITLLNVEVVGGPTADPLLSGSDTMYGNEGSDRMFGQGNDEVDSDGDGLFGEDPPDGIDNDLDGRESEDSTQYDCADGVDNDGDGFADAADPGCAASVDEDGGGDLMYGNEGDDFMEGNHGADLMYGNEGEDDMWGGSSSDATGVVGSGTPPDNLVDTNDIMRGGEDDDVLIGDNGVIVRATDGSGIWLRHQGPRANGDGTPFDMVVRNVGVTQSPEEPGAFGNDWMQGNDGDDEGYGQQGDDYMEGNNGEDALLGDLGLITSSVQDGSNEQVIAPPGPFLEETLYPAGSFYRQFTLFSFTGVPAAAGNDIILGGDDRDSIHGADGDDILNGDGDATILDTVTGVDPNPLTADVDKVFGGDGDDVVWGGRDDDNLWGGHGDDHLDVRPRSGFAEHADDPPLWHTFGRFDFYQGLDLIYGGWGRDALQADVAAPGPRDTDRLVDWAGGYNVFYVCPGAYGEGTITRQGSPHLRSWMQQVIDADGAFYSATADTSGFREFAYVFPSERRQNSHPPHPDHPGHFTCDTVVAAP
jgi:Ca2+-binding RTX toxin-like protein